MVINVKEGPSLLYPLWKKEYKAICCDLCYRGGIHWSYWMSALIIQTPFLIYHFQMSMGSLSQTFKHPRNGGGRSGGPAEVWGQTLKAGRSFSPTNLFGILLNFQCFLTSPLIAGSMCQALSVHYSCIRTPIFNSMIRIYFYSRPSMD